MVSLGRKKWGGGKNLVTLSFEEKHFDYNLCDDVQELELATNKIIFMR